MEPKNNSKVEMLPTDSIIRNPENPRLIFDQAKMDTLKESIHSVGMLVPLIVYRGTEPGRFVLLDGERRWKCARELNLPVVPANIIPTPSRLENILRMFNIHNVREAWAITETAWKIRTVIELVEKGTGNRPNEKVLSALTGMPISGIRRCMKVLAFPDMYQNMVHQGKIKSDFLIEMRPVLNGIRKKFPDIYEKETEKGIINHFIGMAQEKPSRLENVTDFRSLKRVLEADKKGADVNDIRKSVERLFRDKNVTLPSLYDSVKSFYDYFSLEKKCVDLTRDLEPLDVKAIEKRASIINALERLRKTIDNTLAKLKKASHA